MSAKDELHDLVDQLADERAPEALVYLQRLLAKNGSSSRMGTNERMRPLVVAGSVFFTEPQTDLSTLAARQGVEPVTNFDALLGDFCPEDESAGSL